MATRKSVIQSCHSNQRGEGRSPFITVGCVPSRKPTEFLERGHSEHNNNNNKCLLVSGLPCTRITKLSVDEGAVSEWQTSQGDGGRCLLPSERWALTWSPSKSVQGSPSAQAPHRIALSSLTFQVRKGKAGNRCCVSRVSVLFGFGADLYFYGRRTLSCGNGAKGAVPRKTEVSVESCFLPHLLLELMVVIFQFFKKESHVRLTSEIVFTGLIIRILN